MDHNLVFSKRPAVIQLVQQRGANKHQVQHKLLLVVFFFASAVKLYLTLLLGYIKFTITHELWKNKTIEKFN